MTEYNGQEETTVQNIVTITNSNLDIALSVLRDAIVKTGGTSKSIADLATLLNGGLPLALTTNGGLKAGIVESLPAGSSILGAIMFRGDIPLVLVDSTSTPTVPASNPLLLNGGTFQSVVIDRDSQALPVGFTRVYCLASHSGTLTFEESYDGVTYYPTTVLDVTGGVSTYIDWTKLSKQYTRITYVNGGTTQTSFKLLQYFLGVGMMPSFSPDVSITNNVTTQNLNATGVATLNSACSLNNLNGVGDISIQVVGTYTGALTPQVSLDGTNWIALGSTGLLNVNTGVYSATVASATTGIFQADSAGFGFFRLVGLSAMTGTANVTLRGSQAIGMVALDNPLPTGGNNIGGVQGFGALGSAVTGNPLRVGGKAITQFPATLTNGQLGDLITTVIGALIQKPYSIPEFDFIFSAPKGGLLNTATALVIKDGAGAGLRNYITGIDLFSESLTNATELEIREPDISCLSQTIASNTLTTSSAHNLAVGDTIAITATTVTGTVTGSYYVLTVPSATTLTLSASRGGSTLAISGTGVTCTLHRYLWDTKIPTTGKPHLSISFPTPLKGGINVAQSLQTITASGAGAVFMNGQGYIAP